MKDKSLAVSKRDRQLLSILLAFVILFVLYYFVASPAFDNSTILLQDRQLAEAELTRTQTVIDTSQQLVQQVEAKREELTDKYSLFLSDLNEAKILHLMDIQMAAAGLTVIGVQQSAPAVEKIVMPVSGYQPPEYPLQKVAEALNPSMIEENVEGNTMNEEQQTTEQAASAETEVSLMDAVAQMDFGVSFTNVPYDAIYRFLTAVERLERSFIISEVSIGKRPETAGLAGQIMFRSIELPKVGEDPKEDLLFTPTVPQGRTAPF